MSEEEAKVLLKTEHKKFYARNNPHPFVAESLVRVDDLTGGERRWAIHAKNGALFLIQDCHLQPTGIKENLYTLLKGKHFAPAVGGFWEHRGIEAYATNVDLLIERNKEMLLQIEDYDY